VKVFINFGGDVKP